MISVAKFHLAFAAHVPVNASRSARMSSGSQPWFRTPRDSDQVNHLHKAPISLAGSRRAVRLFKVGQVRIKWPRRMKWGSRSPGWHVKIGVAPWMP